ncbi:MAG: hypothetical protein QM621_11150 [Aeromicrobium sp.]|uniref:hypothetical protein n=1 Tax=Aeromicrobium sp. TaxID=1871063 RepID=UPI0039E56B88
MSPPVGEAFGEAVWSVEADIDYTDVDLDRPTSMNNGLLDHRLHVAGDRIVALVDDATRLQAWTADGEEAWSHPITSDVSSPWPTGQIRWMNETVAIVEDREGEGSGLDKDTVTTHLTLLSLDDGSVVAEADFGGWVLAEYGLAFGPETREASPGEGFVVVAEDGSQRVVPADLSTATLRGVVDDVAVWDVHETLGDYYTVSEKWNARTAELDARTPIFIESVDQARGLLMTDAAAFDVHTGERRFDLPSCHRHSHTSPLVHSPGGEYGVWDNNWTSTTAHRCVGEAEQRGVTLTAVDDDGTAYGLVIGSDLNTHVTGDDYDYEFVTVPADGDPQVTAWPEGATPPRGIVEGGLAIHWHPDEGVITANPIIKD